jgi:lipopolysaccharide export LptBFGC system permease protein LptF
VLKTIDRYLLAEFSRPLLFGVGLFSMLIIATVVLSEALRFIQRYNLPPATIFKWLALGAPEIIVLSIPMGALLGTLIAVGRLNGDHEIVALSATGTSLYRMLLPFLLTGLFLSGITILGNELIVPAARSQLVAIKNAARSGQLGARQERVLIPIREAGELRWVLSAAELEGNTLTDIKLLYFDPRSRTNDFIITASTATWAGNHWNFRDLRQTRVQSGSDGDELLRLNSREIDIPDFNIQPQDLEARRRAADDVSARALAHYIAELERRAQDPPVDQDEIQILVDLGREIREEAFKPAQPQRVIVPVHEGGDMVWLLIADDIQGAELSHVKLYHFEPRDESRDYVITAARAVWSERRWTFYGFRKINMDPRAGDRQVIDEGSSVQIPGFNLSPESLELRIQTAEDLDAAQLQERLAELRFRDDPSNQREIRDLQTRLHFKYSIPLTPMFFIFIAFPLAILPQRASNTRGMGVALLIVLGYYAMFTVFQKLGATGALPPVVAAWTPNVLLAGAGAYLMRKRQRG